MTGSPPGQTRVSSKVPWLRSVMRPATATFLSQKESAGGSSSMTRQVITFATREQLATYHTVQLQTTSAYKMVFWLRRQGFPRLLVCYKSSRNNGRQAAVRIQGPTESSISLPIGFRGQDPYFLGGTAYFLLLCEWAASTPPTYNGLSIRSGRLSGSFICLSRSLVFPVLHTEIDPVYPLRSLFFPALLLPFNYFFFLSLFVSGVGNHG